MHTLAKLKSGELHGIKRLQIVEELTEFPQQIIALKDSLEILDLSNNQLSSLPDNFCELVNLRIVFLSQNQFTELPQVLSQCPKLEMVGFKANRISYIAADALPITTKWLILTDNQLSQLPHNFGQLTQLRKLALAGNELTSLPDSMKNCVNLELIRLSANQLTELPDWLFTLPKLSWLAFAGNSFNHVAECLNNSVPTINPQHLQLEAQIGQGASGVIYRATWQHKPQNLQHLPNELAVKIFKGAITSDGYPADELDCCLTVGQHANLIPAIGQINQQQTHPHQLGLIMELIPAGYQNLGLPPSLITCTRDTFLAETEFALQQIVSIGLQIANTMAHMHHKNVSHGDVYAHNIMINQQDNVLFGDFGAASNLVHLPIHQQANMQKVEVRALGCLLDDLLNLVNPNDARLEQRAVAQLTEIIAKCFAPKVDERPNFAEVAALLASI
ncbi:leucine-rich repeat-containing protein kinase family protein [Shewanella gaetbuli]|uniref:Protein kinase n=1 Tax=Shewanella gaetbuli TaxID=220752 RepID=A0A9X1ZL64_9GAMM|nr:leucine-rich repeat-containing protein kinase family protein [Shewanella gaetbuli]MCL1141787.1 protein kinase [Shewanella gaetbuli]